MELDILKKEILQLPPQQPVFIYIGIGTFAGLLNNDGTLAPDNYHQFPPFVQDLRNRVDNLNLFLVLIDPAQENPPYMTRDFSLTQVNQSNTHYKNENGHLQVFVRRQNVHTDTDPDDNIIPNSVNITEELRDLNDFAIANRASLLYHDFSGRRTANVAEYFEYDYADYMDQLVYAMSAREHHGCYFDLSKSNAYFAIKLDVSDDHPRPIIKMFNYFKFILNNNYNKAEKEINTYPIYMRVFIEEQKEQIVNDIRRQFKNIYIAMLRQLRKSIECPDKDVDLNVYLYSELNKHHREIVFGLIKQKEYKLLDDIIFNICANQLEIIARLKKMNISGEMMLRCITADTDSYKWYKTINEFLPS
jgi:hypothetical protein